MIQNSTTFKETDKDLYPFFIRTKFEGASEYSPIMTRVEARRPTPPTKFIQPIELSELRAGIILGLLISMAGMVGVAFFL